MFFLSKSLRKLVDHAIRVNPQSTIHDLNEMLSADKVIGTINTVLDTTYTIPLSIGLMGEVSILQDHVGLDFPLKTLIIDQLYTLALSVLDDPEGISENTWYDLRFMLEISMTPERQKLINVVRSIEGRFYVPEGWTCE